ncbi:hypothetical protein BaRGS_00008315 [Batillaria attramentaria]|uniref:Uncharacterized protein n=1 Tax=Batillaria attramentaria TaxID=370345 RepID=A0ABD0LLT3_9CAEN
MPMSFRGYKDSNTYPRLSEATKSQVRHIPMSFRGYKDTSQTHTYRVFQRQQRLSQTHTHVFQRLRRLRFNIYPRLSVSNSECRRLTTACLVHEVSPTEDSDQCSVASPTPPLLSALLMLTCDTMAQRVRGLASTGWSAKIAQEVKHRCKSSASCCVT